ncbi:MAG: type I pullulanase [Bacteroidales bacterium]
MRNLKNNFTIIASSVLISLSSVSGAVAQNNTNAPVNLYTLPSYNSNDLGCTITNAGFNFKIWSPLAEAVRVKIYNNARGGEATDTYDLSLNPANGVWSYTSSMPLMGKYYTFQIKHNGKWLNETQGIWAKAVGVNGDRAAIIDFSETDPEGWAQDKGPEVKSITDVVIYEMHHRDFSVHPNSGIVNKGKFVALLEDGTLSLNGQKTGIDHLKELGITHVHILPSYDYNSVDETQLPSNTYNWGYDPVNYNAPEGSYSTNPNDPSTRIKEMKQMIQALHKAGIGVIMDVVYNHTALSDNSSFELSAPDYYYRKRADGSFSDASGCGNETASDRQQMRNFIVNSVKFWADEYHIDGFRFDLMAIHDTETMNEVAKELKAINPSIFVYGEGWTAGDSPLPVEKRALKENVAKMENIAVFSDDIRDAIKGHYTDGKNKGFATGKEGNEETVKIGIVAATAHPQVDYSKGNNSKFPYASSPEQIINYVSCHDDLTLTDKLNISMKEATKEDRLKAAKLAQTIVFTSQGTPFMFAGEEIFRDKKGVHNSYKSPDSINAIDWNQKAEYRDLFDYYRNLIALRKAHPAFRMRTAEEIARNIVFDKTAESNLISYSIKNHANGDTWKEVKLIFNGSADNKKVKIPKGNWTIVAQDGQINKDGLGTSKGGETTVPAYSALILAKEK